MGDDIPRLPRPAGWLPDFSADAVERARRTTRRVRSPLAVGRCRRSRRRHPGRSPADRLGAQPCHVGARRAPELAPRSRVPRPPGARAVLRPAPPAAAVRRRASCRRSSPPIGNVPAAVETAIAVLDRPAGTADGGRHRAARRCRGSSSHESVEALAAPRGRRLPEPARRRRRPGGRRPRPPAHAPRRTRRAERRRRRRRRGVRLVPAQRGADGRVPRRARVARPPGVGARRGVGGRGQAPRGRRPGATAAGARRPTRSPAKPPPRTRSRTFYERGGFLSQPDNLRPLPQRRAARATSPRCASSESATTSPTSSVSTPTACPTCRRRARTCPTSTPPTPATRAPGSSTRAPTTSSSSLEQRPPQPGAAALLRLRPERGDRLLQRGVPAAGRAVRRRAAHQGGDLELRPPAGVAGRGRRPPRDRRDEPRRRRRLLRPPGADGPPDGVRGVLLLRRQPGPRPLVPDGQAAADEPRRRGRRGATATTSRCAGSTTRSGATATSRSRCCAGSCSATAPCSTPSTPIRRPARRRQHRRGRIDARRRQAAQLGVAARGAGDPPDGRRAGGQWVRIAVGERPRRHAGDGERLGIRTPPTVWRRGRPTSRGSTRSSPWRWPPPSRSAPSWARRCSCSPNASPSSSPSRWPASTGSPAAVSSSASAPAGWPRSSPPWPRRSTLGGAAPTTGST